MTGVDIEADIRAALVSLADARFNIGTVTHPLAHSLSVVLDSVRDTNRDPVELSGGVYPALKRLQKLRETIKQIEDDKDLWALIRECARTTPQYQDAVLAGCADGVVHDESVETDEAA